MKLNEIMVANNPKLSDMQANALFRIFMSGGSPQGGAEAMKGNNYLLTAGEQLIRQGMVAQSNGGIVITQSGIAALKNQGLIDQNNQPTDLAQKFSDSPNNQGANTANPNSSGSSNTVSNPGNPEPAQ